MDERSDRGEFYPGGNGRGGVPPGTDTDKVDRVSLGEVGESYTLKDVKAKVNQIVRAIAPAAVCLALCASAATGVLEDLPNTAPVVTNEEDAVAIAAVGALGAAVSNKVDVEVAGVHARLDSATNAITVQMAELRSADSNRIATTYAKLSDIPAQPDLSPYALKSELPQDYLVESDITNFATRAWINSQNYAREGTVYTRLDVQDLAIAAASNALRAAHLAEAARLNAASNALWSATLRADAALQREIDALRIVAADSNAVTRLMTSDGKTWQDATGVVWRVEDALGPWTATTNSVVFGSWNQAQPDMDPDLYAIYFAVNGTNAYAYTDAPGNKTNEYIGTSWYWSDWYDPEAEAAKFPITFIRNPIPGGATNAVRQVAYMDEVPSTNGLATVQEVDSATGGVMVAVGNAINLFAEMGTVLYAKALVSNSQDINAVRPEDVWGIALAATNYTDSATNSLATGPIYGLQQSVEGIGSRVSGLESYAATKDGLAAAALAATNYTDQATNALAASMLSRAEAEAGFTDWIVMETFMDDAIILVYTNISGSVGWTPYPKNMSGNIGNPMGTLDSTNLVWTLDDAAQEIHASRVRLRPTSAMDVTRTTDTSVLLNDPELPSARLVPDETPSAYWPNRQRVLRLGDEDSVISMDRTETKLLLVDDPTHLVFVESATVDGNGNTNYTFKTFQQFLNAVSPDTLQETLRAYLPTEGGGSVTGNVEIVGDVLVSGTLAAPHLLRVVTADIEANGFSVSNGVLRANSGLMVSNGMCRINCARAVLGIGTPRLHMETVDPLSHITFGGTWDQPYGNLTDAINITVQNNIVNAFPTFEQAQSYAYLPTNTPPFTTANQLSQDVVSHTPPVGLVTLRNWRTNVLTDSQYNAYVVLQLDSNELPPDKFECDILFRYTSSVPSFYFHFGTFGESPTFYGQTDAFSPTAGTVRLVHMKHIGNDEWIVTYQDLTSWSPPMNMTFTEEP